MASDANEIRWSEGRPARQWAASELEKMSKAQHDSDEEKLTDFDTDIEEE